MFEGTLTITLKNGQLSVAGPIENTLLCYALLEVARDAVHARAQQLQRIVVPAPGRAPTS